MRPVPSWAASVVTSGPSNDEILPFVPATRVFDAYPILTDVVNGAVLFVVPVELTAVDSAM